MRVMLYVEDLSTWQSTGSRIHGRYNSKQMGNGEINTVKFKCQGAFLDLNYFYCKHTCEQKDQCQGFLLPVSSLLENLLDWHEAYKF